MRISAHHRTLIEKYLAGELTVAEQRYYDRLYLEEEVFRAEVRFQSNVLAHLEAWQKWELKEELRELAEKAAVDQNKDAVDKVRN